jgi:putative membrane-bound dehydrogenase-like protein
MDRLRGFILSAVCVLAPTVVGAAEIPLDGQIFTLPDGFSIEVIAKPPLVNRPVTGAFDEQGRFYVSDSSGSNDKVEKQLAERPHRILRLEDTDGDGRFDRQTVFADKMMFPEGTMWLDGSLYVSAPPSIWKLTDTDGDGVADRRQEWIKRTLTHCANDLHGPYAGPDGWIYWCKGAFADQTYQLPGKKPVVSSAAHIFRARPDGTGLEPVMAGGMDNPVDVVFTPGGERIFSTTFLTHSADGKRDGLIHAIYGGVYGKPHGVIAGHKLTGELMPPLVHLGPAAACGLTRYESHAFGAEFKDNLFTCCFNMRKLARSELTPHGASFTATTSDFLVSNSLDFHPTDVIEDADGSLIVINTGGWYKLCCPTSQLWKPDILGAIYRIRRTGAPKIDDPRGLKIAWRDASAKALAELLGDPRPAVRSRAIQELAARGQQAIPALEEALKSASVDARRNAVWALTRIDRPEARSAVRVALGDRDDTVRQTALHSVSVRRDAGATTALIALLQTGTPHNQRAAAEALGRIGDRAAVPALLEASGRLDSDPVRHDRILEHSLTYALIDIDDPSATRVGLQSDRSWMRRAALIALDQMDGGGLEPTKIAALLTGSDPVLKEASSWILGHHSEWGGALSTSLRERVYAQHPSPADHAELERHLTQFATSGAVQDLLAAALEDRALPAATHRIVLAAMRGAGLKQTPPGWVAALLRTLSDPSSPLLCDAVETLRARPVPKNETAEVAESLLRVADNARLPETVRLDALAAVPGGLSRVSPETFAFLRSHLDTELPVTTRAAAAEVLSKAVLTPAQLVSLTDSFKTVGPLEADRLLGAFEKCADETVGLKLIAALKTSPTLTSLSVNAIKLRIAKQPAAVQAQAEELYSRINVDLAKERQRIEEVLPLVRNGDVRRGQLVFARAKASCTSCHQFGYVGGHIGPDLTHVGGIRSERDLLEAIMFPSASLVRSFEPMQIVTKSGKVLNGLVHKDAPDEVVLVASATETIHVPRDEIEEMRPSRVSIMPAGLDKQLTPQELADLVTFLRNAK